MSNKAEQVSIFKRIRPTSLSTKQPIANEETMKYWCEKFRSVNDSRSLSVTLTDTKIFVGRLPSSYSDFLLENMIECATSNYKYPSLVIMLIAGRESFRGASQGSNGIRNLMGKTIFGDPYTWQRIVAYFKGVIIKGVDLKLFCRVHSCIAILHNPAAIESLLHF